MGGKTFPVQRMDAPAHRRLAAYALARLATAYPGARADNVPSYFYKDSFGDADILVEDTVLSHPLGLDAAVSDLAALMGASQWNLNASTRGLDAERRMVSDQGVLSMAIPQGDHEVQLDLVFTAPAPYASALAFLSYNMLGNLVSAQAHCMGFSWGPSGLVWKDPERRIPALSATVDPEQALIFIGYDPLRFRSGFHTLRDIFDYAASPAGFDPSVYALDQKSSRDRRRDARRDNYMSFLEYLQERTWPTPPEPDHAAHLARACAMFPSFAVALDHARVLAARNGHADRLVSRAFFCEATGLTEEVAKQCRARIFEQLGGKQAAHDLAADSTAEDFAQRLRRLALPPRRIPGP